MRSLVRAASVLAAVCLAPATVACDGEKQRPAGGPEASVAASPDVDEGKEKSKKDRDASTFALGTPVPKRPEGLAAALAEVHIALQKEVAGWLEDGGGLRHPRVRLIERMALFQQRLYRKMTRTPKLARAAIRRLEPPLLGRARANFEAGRGLSAGLVPLDPPIRLDTTRPESPHQLLRFYGEGERRFGVDWTILAAVNFVETRFGRVLGPSSAGALGPMQFLPSTWERYGNGGDIRDPHDAILGAARYLRASGAPSDPRGALFAYNRSDAYGEAVMTYARQIELRPQAFYEYYFWQVFVRTTKGDVQLTGPGAAN